MNIKYVAKPPSLTLDKTDISFKILAQNYLKCAEFKLFSLSLMGLLSNGSYLVRLSSVLAEGKLGNQKVSGDSGETSVGSEATLLVTTIMSQLSKSC